MLKTATIQDITHDEVQHVSFRDCYPRNFEGPYQNYTCTGQSAELLSLTLPLHGTACITYAVHLDEVNFKKLTKALVHVQKYYFGAPMRGIHSLLFHWSLLLQGDASMRCNLVHTTVLQLDYRPPFEEVSDSLDTASGLLLPALGSKCSSRALTYGSTFVTTGSTTPFTRG